MPYKDPAKQQEYQREYGRLRRAGGAQTPGQTPIPLPFRLKTAADVLADHVGRTVTTAAAMAISGSCALLTGLLFGQPPALVVAVAVVWGLSIIADSAQFSAAVSELAEPDRVGSALALQAALGFLLTAVSIQVLPLAQARIGWAGAFAILAVGPALGVAAMLRLRARPEAARLAGGRR